MPISRQDGETNSTDAHVLELLRVHLLGLMDLVVDRERNRLNLLRKSYRKERSLELQLTLFTSVRDETAKTPSERGARSRERGRHT